MRFTAASAVLAWAASVQAFRDTTPFLLFSSAAVPSSGSQPEQQLQTSASVLASSKAILSRCPTKRYAIITQPGAHAHDIRGSSSPMTSLRQAARRSDVQTSLEVAEVYGALEGDYLAGLIEHECQAAGETPPHIEEITLPGLPKGKGRASVLEQNDRLLGETLAKLEELGSYTVIYMGTLEPPSASASESETGTPPYQAEFQDSLHMELKRDQAAMPERRQRKEAVVHKTLFEQYQFFTPAIFAGLMSVGVFLAILYVGLRAVSSLQVTYGAFEKEMGPAAQKKQG